NDRTGAAMGTHESRKEHTPIRQSPHASKGMPTERGGWTTCPSRTAPRPIRPLAGCGRTSNIRRLPHGVIINGAPHMQVPHPLDTEIDEMDQTRRDMVRLFASDGTI